MSSHTPDFKLKVSPGTLHGEVTISGAKNSALRLLAASLLSADPIHIRNYPAAILDAQVHVDMLRFLGKECAVGPGDTIAITEPGALRKDLRWEGRSIRNTLLILGALVARFGYGAVPLPGGCKLGDRKYDIHVMLLTALGAHVREEDGMLVAESSGRLVGAEIHLPIRSTGATENGIICASLARGTTRIWNPHIRPEILDLIHFLRKMGARIEVRGQESIIIHGVDALGGCLHEVIPDNIEAITWLAGAAITRGEVTMHAFPFDHLEVPLLHLRESGIKIYRCDNTAIVKGGSVYPVEISTGPYPGINSDMQPFFAILGAVAQGTTKITDLRFVGRYAYAEEFTKMGIRSEVRDNMLQIQGGSPIHGAEVRAHDLRAGAALMLAGLVAKGDTLISDAWQIERGYCNLEDKCAKLGIRAKKVNP